MEEDKLDTYRFDPQNPLAHFELVGKMITLDNAPFPGDVDIACLGSDAVCFDAAALTMQIYAFGTKGQGCVYHGIHLLLPPQTSGLSEKIRRICADILSVKLPKLERQDIEGRIDRTIHFHEAERLDFLGIEQHLVGLSQSAFLVLEAARYLPPQPVSEFSSPRPIDTPFASTIRTITLEDVWVKRILELSHHLRPVASAQKLYFCLVAGESEPILSTNITRLMGAPGAVMALKRESHKHSAVLEQSANWHDRVAQGERVQVFAEIDLLFPESEVNRALLKAQVFNAEGRCAEGFQLVAPHLNDLSSSDDPHMLTSIARMAFGAGHWDKSKHFIALALGTSPLEAVALQNIHQHCLTLKASDLAEQAFSRLRLLFPHAVYSIAIEVSRATRRGDYGRVILELGQFTESELPDEFRYDLAIATGLSDPSPDYDRLTIKVAERFPTCTEDAALQFARHALQRGMFDDAVRLLETVKNDQKACGTAADLAVKLISRWSCEETKKQDATKQSLLRAISVAVATLAAHPEDALKRTALSNALAPSVLGDLGTLTLARMLLAPAEVETIDAPAAKTPAADPKEYAAFYRRYLSEKKKQKPLLLRPQPLPRRLANEPHEALWTAAVDLLEVACISYSGDPEHRKSIINMLKAAMDLAFETGQTSATTDLVRMCASAFANAGDSQAARDMAEHALRLSGESDCPVDRRAAWRTFADTYHRCSNLPEAILGWLCGSEIRASSSPAKRVAADLQLNFRLLRDTGLYAEALHLLDNVDPKLLQHVSQHRLSQLRTTILVKQGINGENGCNGSVSLEVERELEEAINGETDLVPSTMLAGQAIVGCRVRGEEPALKLLGLFESACSKLPRNAADRIRAASEIRPTREQMLSAFEPLSSTRYAFDLGTDVLGSVGIARRALDGFVSDHNAENSFLALELLSIHSVRPPHDEMLATGKESSMEQLRDWSFSRAIKTGFAEEVTALTEVISNLSDAVSVGETTTLGALLASPDSLVDFAKQLSQHADIFLFGLGQKNQLVRTCVRDGMVTAPMEDEQDVFDVGRLALWGREHPFSFGDPAHPDRQRFEYAVRAMEGIGTTVAFDTTRTSLLVFSPDLAEIPATLFTTGGEPDKLCSVALTPSLSWLRAAHERPRATTGRQVAWLLPPEDGISPLRILLNELEEPLTNLGFIVETTTTPQELCGSDLAIIGAHGAIWSCNGSFRAVSDELSERISSVEFAAKLAGCGVVVLLVCSGGRLDRESLSFRSSGLPFELLRRGCRAVVASPWPLDSLKARRWALDFVKEYEDGSDVGEATYRANRLMNNAYPELCDFLAMNVIGDPFMRKHGPQSLERVEVETSPSDVGC